ncbi:MAG: YkgJ family cysteine cluster protein [Humidesulfovibrio sp.]|nr:YkgJ family cysteine cluster protein [Humidesulfovibrio sp.]
MALDFSDFFKRYEAIIQEADQVFRAVRDKFAENVRCEKGCSDCCHALFDLTLVEALYLNSSFNAKFSGKPRNNVLERADQADRQVHRLKHDAFKAVNDGKNAQEILAEMAKVRVRCPLLDDAGACVMYENRPVTCRIYGVPTAIGGSAHTCGKSGFEKGKPYPTVYLDRIQDKLYALSHELATAINSRYKGLGEVLVPASLALLTDYSEDYLGVTNETGEKAETAETAAPAKAAKPVQDAKPAKKSVPLSEKLAAGKDKKDKKDKGKGLPACAGCSPETKKGGCSGCSPKSFTIGQAPARPAKPAAKKPVAQKAPAQKAAVQKPVGKKAKG